MKTNPIVSLTCISAAAGVLWFTSCEVPAPGAGPGPAPAKPPPLKEAPSGVKPVNPAGLSGLNPPPEPPSRVANPAALRKLNPQPDPPSASSLRVQP